MKYKYRFKQKTNNHFPSLVYFQKFAGLLLERRKFIKTNNTMDIIKEIIIQARQFEGETETGGQNRSPFIDKINIWMPLAELGNPYCMTGICYTLHLLEEQFLIKFDLPKHPGAIDFYELAKPKYKTHLFEIGNLVFWKFKTGPHGHVSIIVGEPDENGNFPAFEFNVVVGDEAGVFETVRNTKGDSDLDFYGLLNISTAWKAK
ncbi:hypothetical protein AB670_01504 [Chryseobacterium sp. MOF25P]|uniref:hypothetical protein n=1 Tax=unclassified Chryseobacterium TaxID=2593645 RepID=UPI0008047EAC|nr:MULTISPECIES: hypothetical protein [unclassified Chryseobacterium]OBW42084.1 hypothetical protein AB670_01504 [Chryseobacterium sp. MOF25P]OBW45449.1 hypothetical protein AB671_02409 [Chryseobacterium sp. BGARF1]